MIPGKVWRACQSEVIYLKGGHQFLGLAIPAPFLLCFFYVVTRLTMKSDSSLLQIINKNPAVLSVSHHLIQGTKSHVTLFLRVSNGANAKIGG